MSENPKNGLNKVSQNENHNEDELIKAKEALDEASKKMTYVMENMRIAEYVKYLNNPKKLLWSNFLIGVARGLGSTVGLAIILALLFFILRQIITLNLPFISDWLSRLIFSIQENLEYFNSIGMR